MKIQKQSFLSYFFSFLLVIAASLFLMQQSRFLTEEVQAAAPNFSGGSPANGTTGVSLTTNLTINADTALSEDSINSTSWTTVATFSQSQSGLSSCTPNDIFFTSASVGYIACGSSGAGVAKTTDGGITWVVTSAGVSTGLNEVFFLDANTGWAVGKTGTIVKTTNAGATWTAQTSNTSQNLNDIYFADANTGYTVGNNAIVLKTANGGATWTSQDPGTAASLNSVYFINANTGWIAAPAGNLLRTTNGGSTWTGPGVVLTPNFYDIEFVDAATGWAVGNNGNIYKSTDGGATWNRQSSFFAENPIPGFEYLFNFNNVDFKDVDFIDANIGYIVTSLGTVLKTTNAGSGWIVIENGTGESLSAISTPDKTNRYVLGSGSLFRQGYNVLLQANSGNTQGGSASGSSLVTSVTLSNGNQNITATESGLSAGTWYTFTVNTSIKSSDGTANAGTVTRAFRTAELILSMSSPSSGATGVARDVTLSVLADRLLNESTLSTSGWSSLARVLSTDLSTIFSGSVYGADFPTGGVGYVVGSSGGIAKTTAGGTSWVALTSGTSNNLRAVDFIDANTGWAVGNSGTILKTTDGGTTWTAQTSGTSDILSDVYFLNANTGYVAADQGRILKTTNGGSTWTISNSGASVGFSGIHFIDENTGWAVGSNGVAAKTINGGSSWTTPLTTGTSQTLTSVRFVNSSTGWAVGAVGTIIKTTDGGYNWTAQTSGLSSAINSISIVDANTVYVAGAESKVLKTTDGGASWVSVYSSGTDSFIKVLFPTLMDHIAVGTGKTLIRQNYNVLLQANSGNTQNGSATGNNLINTLSLSADGLTLSMTHSDLALSQWYTLTVNTSVKGTDGVPVASNFTRAFKSVPLNVLSTTIENLATGVALNAEAKADIDASLDGSYLGGLSTTQTSGVSDDLKEVFFVDSSLGYAVGANGKILKTTNAGSAWGNLSSGVSTTLNGVYFVNSNTGWAIGNSGAILKTTNGGTTWAAQTSGVSVNLLGIQFIDENTGYVSGSDSGLTTGALLKTTNGGSTWTTLRSGSNTVVTKLYFYTATTGWAVGSNGLILQTTDSGTTWTTQTSGSTATLWGVHFPTASRGFAVGSGGTILKTSNGGSSWTTQSSGTTQDLVDVQFTSEGTGFVAGNSGTFFKSTDSGTSWFGLQNVVSSSANFNGVHFPVPQKAWVVGASGTILTFDEYILLQANSPNSSTGTPSGSSVCTGLFTTSGGPSMSCSHSNLSRGAWYTWTINLPIMASSVTRVFQTIPAATSSIPSTIRNATMDITAKISIKVSLGAHRDQAAVRILNQAVGDKRAFQNPGTGEQLKSVFQAQPLYSFSDITKNAEQKEELLTLWKSDPELQKTLRGQSSDQLVLEVWEEGSRENKITEVMVSTNFFGEGSVTLPPLPKKNYDFTLRKKTFGLSLSLNSQPLQEKMVLDFSEKNLKTGDLNQDGKIDLTDLKQLVGGFKSLDTSVSTYDFNEDEVLDLNDIIELLKSWGTAE